MSSICICALTFVAAITGGENYLAGRNAEHDGHYPEAVSAYNACVAGGGPLAPYARLRTASCVAASGNKADAIDQYRAVLKDCPKGPWVRMGQVMLAEALADRNRPEAAALYSEALEFDPKPWWVAAYDFAGAKIMVDVPGTRDKAYERLRKIVTTTYQHDRRVEAAKLLGAAPDPASRACAAWGFIVSNELVEARPILLGLIMENKLAWFAQDVFTTAVNKDANMAWLDKVPGSAHGETLRLALAFLVRLIMNSNHALAETYCNTMKNVWPAAEETGECMWWLANHLAKDNKAGEAAAKCIEMAKSCPKHNKADDALFMAAELIKKDKPVEAAKLYRQLGTQYPLSRYAGQGLYLAGTLNASLGKTDEAAADWAAVLDCGPGNYYAHVALHRLHATRPGKFPSGQELRVNGGASHLSAFPPAQEPLTKMPEKFITVPRFERLLFFGLDGLPEAEWEALEIGKNLKRDPATSFVYEVMAEMGLSMTAMNYADAYGWGLQDGKPTVKRLRVNYPRAWWRFVSRIGKELNVDPYLILAVARQESTFRPALTSSAGACGVMQVMPGTAKAIAKNTGLRADRLDNPHQSLQLGARYIADMLRISHGNIVYALASYNAGPGNCRKWQKQFAGKDMESFIEAIPFAETRDYVKRVLGNYAAYYSLYPATN